MNKFRINPVSILFIALILAQVGLFGVFSGWLDVSGTPILESLPTLEASSQLAVFFGVAILELIVLYAYLKQRYMEPIRTLRTEIAHFLAGAPSPKRLDTSAQTADISYVGSFFHRSLEILKTFKEEFQSGRVLRSEVEFAAEIQRHVLKKTHPIIPSLEIVADTKSATEVGGDSYDIVHQGDNLYIYIGDVTGHGVASGFVMMMVNALISGFSKMIENSADILARTNEILKPRVKSNMLMTMLMVRWNERDKKLYMTGAWHEYLLIYKKFQNRVYAVKSGGVALGMTRDISKILKEIQLSFEPGDCIIMYTDGITESRNGNKESDMMFGVDRLIQSIVGAPVKTATGIFKNVTIELSKFMGYNHRQFDDISLIVVGYKESGPQTEETRQIAKENITEWNWNN